jgi:hypothetical protein
VNVSFCCPSDPFEAEWNVPDLNPPLNPDPPNKRRMKEKRKAPAPNIRMKNKSRIINNIFNIVTYFF